MIVRAHILQRTVRVSLGRTAHFQNTIINNSGGTQTYIAATPLGGHRVVAADSNGQAVHCDQTNPGACLAILGLSTGAVSQGEPVTPILTGTVEEPGWTWTPDGLVFLTGLGELTQAEPQSGPTIVVGQAISPTRLVLTFQPRFF